MPRKFNNIPKRKTAARASAIQAKLQQAIELHQQGRLAEAQQIYGDILKLQPLHADALHLIGLIAYQAGNHQRAVDLIGKAIEISPNNAVAYSNRGLALHQLKQLDAALESYDRAIAIAPDNAEAHSNRGNVLHELKRLDAAISDYDRAIEIKPDYAEAYYNRGNALLELKLLGAAVDSYERAIAIKPNLAEAYSNRGNALQGLKHLDAALASFNQAIAIKPDYAEAYSNRGNALQELKQLDAALASFNQAIAIQPDYAEAYSNRGNALQELKQFAAALESFNRAITIQPDYAEAYSNRGNALKELKQFPAALESFNQAIAIRPDYAEAYYNRGNALQELKRLDAALESFNRAIAIKPDYAEAHWNKALTLLLAGDFDRGWDLYEWRWRTQSVSKHLARIARPFATDWDGQPLKGSLLVLPEQGLGDEIFYSGMLNDLKPYAQSITVCVDERLVGLYQRSFDAMNVVSQQTLGADVHFDAQVYMASLGRFFRRSALAFENISVPYLHACSERARKLRAEIAKERRLICGLSWVSKNADIGRDKSLRLQDLVPVLELPAIDFVDLQYGDTSKEQAALHSARGLTLRGVAQIDNFNDIDGLAALIEACDVIVTVSNTTAHLAAAMGKPVMVMLPFSPGLMWYWHVDAQRSVWYPSARLFRQERIGDWKPVVERVREALVQQSGR
jgi:tetratricopeptide (TPR) repeat protein